MPTPSGLSALQRTEDIQNIDITDLRLDATNPRFGELAINRRNQTDILDFIVQTFGVEDILSSLSVNGYFTAEPLICRKEDSGNYVVVEGNRRLASCLILLGDERAKNQAPLTNKYQKRHLEHDAPPINPMPAIVVQSEEENRTLLSYLGVRHIAAAKAWDSYAKAVWVYRVITTSTITLQDAAEMIGDEHRTLARLLEGYNFIQQLIRESRFRPEDSVRKGRGSNIQYPFSWAYTILGYSTVRQFLDIHDNPEKVDPIPSSRLDNAELLTLAMFGNSSLGRSSALRDSRQLGQLALCVEDEEKVALLRKGKSLEEIEILMAPLEERLRDGLNDTKEILRDLNNRLTEEDPAQEIAAKFVDSGKNVKQLATSVHKRLIEAVSGRLDDDE